MATLLFAGATWLVLKLLRKWVPSDATPRWLLLATRQVLARPVYAVVQVSALSIGLLALVLLVLLRTDLINSWRKKEAAKGSEAGLAMRQVYKQVRSTLPTMLKFSKAL